MNTTRSQKLRAPSLASTLIVTALILLATGCSIVPEPKADPTRHYVLTTPANARATPKEIPQDKPTLALHAIEMPAYLRARKNITVRQGANEIVYHEYARWAETLEDGVTRIICERILASGAISGIALLPGRAERTYDLTIRVLECEGAIPTDGSAPAARFSAEYEITQPNGKTITGTRNFAASPGTWDGKDFSALATQLGQSAAALADDIAKTIPAK